MFRKHSKGSQSYIFHESDLILVSITDSLVADTALEQIISAINVKEAAPRRISDNKAKSKMAWKKGTVRKVLVNSSHSWMTPEHLARKLNIGLDKARKF